MAQTIDKKVKLDLVGTDGNAFAILGNFQHQARKEGWTKEEIDTVINEATAGDYDHLLATIIKHCKEQDFEGTGGEIDPEDFE
jgi:hypothetical protein